MKKITALLITLLIFSETSFAVSAADKVYTASSSGSVSLRLTPDEESMEIVKIPACSKVKLIKTDETWGKVIFKKKCGWINMSFTAASYESAAETTGNDSVKNVRVVSKKGQTNMYNVPSTKEKLGAKIKFTVPGDTILSITRETQGGWGLVSMNGKYAWVKMKDTEKYESFGDAENEQYGIFYVYTLSKENGGVAFLSQIGGSEIAKIPDCVKLTVREKKNNYGYVTYDGMNGWINLDETAQSYSNAISNAGVSVYKEYITRSGGEDIKLMSIPSFEEKTGTYEVESVGSGAAVFVLRQTCGGWSLISQNGIKGWIAPEDIEKVSEKEDIKVEMTAPYDIYVSTKEGSGIKLYSNKELSGDAFCTIPETAKMTVIAKSGNAVYMKSDYAAGWTKLGEYAKTQKEAVESYNLEKVRYYKITDETTFHALPIYSELCGGKELAVLPLETKFTVIKIVKTGKRKWGYTEINGVKGWVNLNCASRTLPTYVKVIIALLIALVAFSVIVLIIKFILKKRDKKSA